MAQQTHKRIDLFEHTSSTTPHEVDREQGVIRNVKVLGRISRNGREYSDKALNNAVALLEGYQVNLYHNREKPNAERGFLECVGSIHGLELKPDGVYAKEFRVKKSHPAANVIFESAERFPNEFGLSINAEGEVVRRGGKTIVESIVNPRSVDVVGKPATTNGIFESENAMVKKTLRQLVESVGTAEHKSRFKKILEDDGYDSSMTEQPTDVSDDYEAADAGDTMEAAFQQLILAVVTNKDLDAAAKKAQIGKLIDMCDELMNGPADSTESDADKSDESDEESGNVVAESVKKKLDETLTLLQESRNDQLSMRAELRLLQANIKATPERVKALTSAKSETERTALLESWPPEAKAAVAKPKFSPPSVGAIGEYPQDSKAFARLVQS